jgi:hypothetical protein
MKVLLVGPKGTENLIRLQDAIINSRCQAEQNIEVKEISADEKYFFEDSIVKICPLTARHHGQEIFSYVVAPKAAEP